METDNEIAQPLLGPLVEAVRALGLTVREPHVLGAGANVVVHMAPSPVVARVATLTADMRDGAREYLVRERDVSAALCARGMNALGPTKLVDPGPHAVGDRLFLLMEYRPLKPVDLQSRDHALMAARAFAELSIALADLPAALSKTGQGQPWAEITRLTKTVTPTTDNRALGVIGTAIEQLRQTEPTDRWQLVHGDAHRLNVAMSEGDVVWFDFEDANQRPLAWDLATMRRAWPAAGDEACRLLDVDPRSSSMSWHHELREVYALLWNLLYAQRYQRARAAATDRLDNWLANQK